jgi:H/ACA ribonucleoprotein complex subunit 4
MSESNSESEIQPSSFSPELQELLNCSFVIIDKPRGPSSHEVTAFVRKILEVQKTGHSGTLDPNVSGVLIVAIGKATRLLSFFPNKDKKYVCLMRTKNEQTPEQFKSLFKRFTGELTQTPPKMSAVAKRPRKRKVYYIEPIQLKPKEALFEVSCEAGTYIRVLVSEMGRYTGGAQMLELRRVAAGDFTEKSAYSLQMLSDAFWAARRGAASELSRMLLPPQKALSLRKVVMRGAALSRVAAGAPLFAPGLVSVDDGIMKGEAVALVTDGGKFAGVGRASVSSVEARGMKNGIIAMPDAIVVSQEEMKQERN